MKKALFFLVLIFLLIPGLLQAKLVIGRTLVSNEILEVALCESDAISPGEIVLSPYGCTVYRIDDQCKISGILQTEGPINVFNPEDYGGIGLIYGRPMIYGNWGGVIYNGKILVENIKRNLPDDVTDAFFHHDVIKTKWGTLMAILAHISAQGKKDDVIVEFNGTNEIISQLSLNTLLFGHKWGAVNLGFPYQVEDWLHTNSIDTTHGKIIIVSTRNTNEIQMIDWAKKELINSFGSNVLSLQHHAKFQDDGTILVFDNGAIRKQSGIAIYNEHGTLLDYHYLPFFASAYGSVQKLTNGNWLTINGVSGEVFEFTPDISKKVLHIKYRVKDWVPFHSQYKSILYRAIKVEP